MAGIFDGLGSLGLGNLEGLELFEAPKPKETAEQKTEVVKVEEKDLIYDKTFSCPVCYQDFTCKILKTGKAKLLGSEWDLRPKYDGIDPLKYDVPVCTTCGYAALNRFFPNVMSAQAKLIKANISTNVRMSAFDGEIYTYEEALERYKLALVNTVVKRGKASEKAYVCLKSAWLLRSYKEWLDQTGDTTKNRDELRVQEEEYLANAFTGFVEARKSENFPMCGMDESTIDYLLAELATHFKKYDVASKLIAGLLASPSAPSRMKDKARDLKDEILAQLKKRS